MSYLDAAPPRAPHGWVPADRRRLGLDRSAMRYALPVALLAVVMIWVVPAVDAAVPGGRPVRVGDQLGLAGGVRFVPAAGWTIEDGIRVGEQPASGYFPASATVTDGPLSLSVQTAPFAGAPIALLDQIDQTNAAIAGQRQQQGLSLAEHAEAVRTQEGDVGAVVRYRTTDADGALAAFVIHGTGVEVVVQGPATVPDDVTQDVDQMIASVSGGAA